MRFLLVNQCFYPDVVSTAQHLADLAHHLKARGHQVTVIAGRNGYDDHRRRFPPKEDWQGIEIRRIPCLGLGKSARWRRALESAGFMISLAIRLLATPKPDAVVALTSPPLVSVLAAAFARLHRSRFFFWVMDLNPDEAIAAGWLRQHSHVTRILEAMSRFSLRQADQVIALDRFMKERLQSKGVSADKVAVMPPWSHDPVVRFDAEGRRAFRLEHGLEGKFLVMYSGNHSPCHPLNSLLAAARRLVDVPEIHFCFVGGGSEFRKIQAAVAGEGIGNITCLPYQPLQRLSASLSAADLHAVVMGESFTGIVHPCKIYNILAAGMPFFYVGPAQSHIADIIHRLEPASPIGVFRHGESEAVARHILRCHLQRRNPSPGAAMEEAARHSAAAIIPRLAALLESPSRAKRPLVHSLIMHP